MFLVIKNDIHPAAAINGDGTIASPENADQFETEADARVIARLFDGRVYFAEMYLADHGLDDK